MTLRRRWWELLALAVPVVVAAVWLGLLLAGDGEDAPAPEPIAVVAAGPHFATLDALVAASDLVVVGEVRSVADGRAITDPEDPTVGIRTRLVALEVEHVLSGPAAATVVVEEEASLLDRTPIVVNGVAPSQVGDRGVYFLVGGDDPAAAHHALVNEQGRYLVDGAGLDPAGTDRLSAELAARGLQGLAAAVAEGVTVGAS